MSTTAEPRTPEVARVGDGLSDPAPAHPASPAAITKATTLTRCLLMPSATDRISKRFPGHSNGIAEPNPQAPLFSKRGDASQQWPPRDTLTR